MWMKMKVIKNIISQDSNYLPKLMTRIILNKNSIMLTNQIRQNSDRFFAKKY